MKNLLDWLNIEPTASPKTQSVNVIGPIGDIEVLVDYGQNAYNGIALIAHPQPLLGGSPKHKIPHLLAATLAELGWLTLRPYFRGTGHTQGTYDHGVGETEDILTILSKINDCVPDAPVALIGFSFGAFVINNVANALQTQGIQAEKIILIGLPAGEVAGGRTYDTTDILAQSTLIHGDQDEYVPINNIFDLAKKTQQPVIVLPGANHFFKDYEKALKRIVTQTIRST